MTRTPSYIFLLSRQNVRLKRTIKRIEWAPRCHAYNDFIKLAEIFPRREGREFPTQSLPTRLASVYELRSIALLAQFFVGNEISI